MSEFMFLFSCGKNPYVVKPGLWPRVPHSPDLPQGNAFSKAVYNSAKFGPRLSPVGGQGWRASVWKWVRFYCVCLGMNQLL